VRRLSSASFIIAMARQLSMDFGFFFLSLRFRFMVINVPPSNAYWS
jgi:hypothetical protein